jgi:cell wall-associated NlpC family hydrolase
MEHATGGWDRVSEKDLALLPPCHYLVPTDLARQIREQVARAAVVREAMTWEGTPWHHAARVRGAGVDCGQLLAAVYEAAGVIPHLDTEAYPNDFMCHSNEEQFLGYVERHAHQIQGPAQPGDIALYRIGRVISHAAIVLDWPRVIHAYATAEHVVQDDAEANAWLRAHFVGIWSPWGEA